MQEYHGTLAAADAEEYAWHTLGEAFCEPVTIDDDPKGYLPTQIIAELFKANGFDGIAYRCSVLLESNHTGSIFVFAISGQLASLRVYSMDGECEVSQTDPVIPTVPLKLTHTHD